MPIGDTMDTAQLARDALDAAARHIQDALGVETGDLAGLYFMGEKEQAMLAILEDYIKAEISYGNTHN